VVDAEGWKWTAVAEDGRYDYGAYPERIYPQHGDLSASDQKKLDRLVKRRAELEEASEDMADMADVDAEEYDRLSGEIDEIESKAHVYSDEDKARAGALITLSHEGAIRIERGLFRKEDVQKRKVSASELGGEQAEGKPAASPLLTFDLSRIRTAMIQAAMVGEEREKAALAVVAHAFALTVFYQRWDHEHSPLDLAVHVVDVKCPENHAEVPAPFDTLEADFAAWKGRLPARAGELQAWCFDQDTETLMRLLASAAARTVNAKVEKHERTTHRHAACDALADQLALDPHAYASVDRLAYFGRTSKAHILDVLGKEVNPERAANCAKMKKAELADTASAALAGKWLPADLMRTARGEAPKAIDLDDTGEDEGLDGELTEEEREVS
jgi:ParB family chromosome partitioning protein